jgi:hypothetical protein
MIEQTALVVSKWNYSPPKDLTEGNYPIIENTLLDVMRKTAPTKKGIACRFTAYFTIENIDVLEYVAENTYVIDFEEVIDERELLSMIRNTYNLFKEKFDVRKLGTVLQDKSLLALEESKINLDAILPLLA